ncbi:MAG TPA: hypothetical protein VID03_11905 [Acidimicrobiia bacterium]|jgi:hypothetical protein
MALVILAVMNPPLIFTANTPTGGDMGAHVQAPAFLRDVLLPGGQILGWSQDWFAGFPMFYFYFPLPSLVIVLLDLVLPYGVAFKLATVFGLLATPAAAYYLARSMRFGRPVAIVAASSGAVLAFMESYTIYGANISSTLAGEFSFSWSFAFSLLYLGLLMRAVRDDPKYTKWAALALALTALSHIITTIIVIIASLGVLPWKNGLRRAAPTWFWGFAITAFWSLPLLARLSFSSDMAWIPLRAWDELFPVEIWLLLPLAVAGAIWSIRRTPRTGPVLIMTLFPLLYYPLPNLMPELFPEVFTEDRWKLWNGRPLPYWYFGVTFFAAIAVGGFVMWAVRRLPQRVNRNWARLAGLVGGAGLVIVLQKDLRIPRWAPIAAGVLVLLAVGVSYLWNDRVAVRNLMTSIAAGVLTLGALAGVSFSAGWAYWNYKGYEGKAQWPEYEAVLETVADLPPGRIQWEYSKDQNKYGTPMALMLFPYWDGRQYPSMEGLFFESSLSMPFHFLNQAETSASPSQPVPGLQYHRLDLDRGIPHMQTYGVQYYITFTPEAAELAEQRPELTEVGITGPFRVFELSDSPMVSIAEYQPVVYTGHEVGLLDRFGAVVGIGPDEDEPPTFRDLALAWYDDVNNLDRWIVEDGPEAWPHIESLDQLPSTPIESGGVVTDVQIDQERISFHTTAVGVPHLVKVSYFPNWKATGAEGPYHATPSLMVVVPTQEDVVLEFVPKTAEWTGLGLTLLGLAGLVAAGVLARKKSLKPHGSSLTS